jgi:hypothetical protein
VATDPSMRVPLRGAAPSTWRRARRGWNLGEVLEQLAREASERLVRAGDEARAAIPPRHAPPRMSLFEELGITAAAPVVVESPAATGSEPWRRFGPTRREVTKRPPAPANAEAALQRFLGLLAGRAWSASASRTRAVACVLLRLGPLADGLHVKPWLRRAARLNSQPFRHRTSRERAVRRLLGAGGLQLLREALRERAAAKDATPGMLPDA